MKQFKITTQFARKLQAWAIKQSTAKPILDKIPLLEKSPKEGIYADYSIDKTELSSPLDYPDVGVVTMYGIKENKKHFLGEIRAYNFETYWLSTLNNEECESIEEWFESINDCYNTLP